MKKTLRAVYKDHKFSLDELLEKGDSCRIHERNLQKLVMKTFKVKTNLAPRIKEDVYEFVECSYSLKYRLKLKSRKINSLKSDIRPTSFVGAEVWNSLPSGVKKCKSLELFKSKIKKGIPKVAIVNFVKLASIKSATY